MAWLLRDDQAARLELLRGFDHARRRREHTRKRSASRIDETTWGVLGDAEVVATEARAFREIVVPCASALFEA
jgi:hypothetical protein